ncbi:AAA family ATPase [Georgenia sunbinii]|uniref:AAA family ATPase n=1 Tax=Georgenia sunbinii TaxID=3117728 RepID=UPI002F262024
MLSGLPGVGKTSTAASVAGRVDAVHLSILGCGLPAGWQVGVAAYEAARCREGCEG